MTTTEWLLMAQTAILFVTGLVVIWYTYETHQLRKGSQQQLDAIQRGHRIAAKSALLASYNHYLSVVEDRNNLWASQGKQTWQETSDLRQQIDTLEKGIVKLLDDEPI